MVSMAISAARVMKTRSMRRSDFFSLSRSCPIAFAGGGAVASRARSVVIGVLPSSVVRTAGQRSSARAIGCSSGSAGSSSMPIRASSSAFWKCLRFSASSSTIENGASRMASVISSPRIAGQAVHELRARLGVRPELLVDLVGRKDAAQLVLLVLGLHPPPADGEDDVGLRDGLDGVVGERQGGAGLRAVGAHERLDLGRHLLLGRRRHDHAAAEAASSSAPPTCPSRRRTCRRRRRSAPGRCRGARRS